MLRFDNFDFLQESQFWQGLRIFPKSYISSNLSANYNP